MRNASLEDCQLLAESEILQRDLFVAAKDQKDHPKKREDCVQHEAGSVSASSLKINRLGDRWDLARHRPRSDANVFGGTLSRSSSALVPAMARCRAFSECSGSCCVPDRDPGWPMLPVSVDSPRSDSPQPCGQPKQQFPCPLAADREFDTDTQRSFRQSIFGATSTKFPARRWSPLAPASFAQAFWLSPPIAVVGHR